MKMTSKSYSTSHSGIYYFIKFGKPSYAPFVLDDVTVSDLDLAFLLSSLFTPWVCVRVWDEFAWTVIPFKPLSVMFIHQLSLSNCKFTRKSVIADNPMSVTCRQELRSSSWRLNRTLENLDTSSSDNELQPFSTRTLSGMSWFVP